MLRSFSIPVGTSGWGRVSTDKTHCYDPVEAATLVVGMMVSVDFVVRISHVFGFL